MFRRLTTFQLTVDIVIAALCVLVRSVLPFDTAAGWLMLLLMGGALAIRRLSPGLALIVAWAGAIIQMAGGLPPDAANLAILAVLFSTARHGEPRVKWAGLASAGIGAAIATGYFIVNTYVVSGVAGNVFSALFVVATFASCLAVLGLSWTLGLLARTWATAREARRAELEAERTVVVEQERNRIARDMHDVVAHSLAVVIAQADGARYAAATDPTAVDTALATISGTAREALADVRLLLAQLRHNQQEGPQPVLADLGVLLEQFRASGLDVDFGEQGSPTALASSQQLALYRIVQEALTNALRHGNAAGTADVALVWEASEVSLTVTSPLRAGTIAPAHVGHGITGMRERALLVGGALQAAPDRDRFVVSARIPVTS